MSTAKSLSDDQISTIRAWAEDGDQLPDIQRKLAEEFQIKVTYLETRFLIEDLGIEIKVEEPPQPEPEEEADADEETDSEEGAGDDEALGDGVSVTVDSVQRPGALVSGRAKFAGGKEIAWYLDQYGRLGMDSDDPEFRPSEEQAMAFQKELQAALQKSGF